ncbi:hypothetical protein IC235_06035 [Hymenobacter sp. BT664]|uniref:Uncharacterized protein n=1 Tax=Hymenobacter montanus TaxID=2771359 RepID=A0A927BC98_9BACT|nr:hypothetical protein [Hymenobacter montanus]MBD2767448.1 hypothetical protein [Hymenobacter montanus]
MSSSTRSVCPLRICCALPRSGWRQASACLSTEDARYELNDQLGNAQMVFHRPTTVVTTAGAVEVAIGLDDAAWQADDPRLEQTGSLIDVQEQRQAA